MPRLAHMTGLTPYLHFDGTTAAALHAYQAVFGGELQLHTYGDFGRDDAPAERIAHGILTGRVNLFAADGDAPLTLEGVLFALLGTAAPAELERWFAALAVGGEVLDPLQQRAWGASDGQVRDRFGVTWLIGYEA